MNLDVTGIGSVADFAKSVVERIFPEKMSEAEKATAQLSVQEMLDKRETDLLGAQKSIIVAEMNQADEFTKRARPTVVYAGLAFIGLAYVALPMLAWIALILGRVMPEIPAIQLPSEFWWAWSGVVGIWVVGRSAEKRGVAGKAIDLITGHK